MDEGYGVDRRQVMYNDFVLIGPAADPAGVRGKDVPAAFRAFADSGKNAFVSRGDNSGTHNAEKSCGPRPAWPFRARILPGMWTPDRA